jgi:hypothetical protein
MVALQFAVVVTVLLSLTYIYVRRASIREASHFLKLD